MKEIIKSSDTSKGKVQLYRSGIMHQTYTEGAELSIQDSSCEMEIYMREYCRDMRRPILVDLNHLKSVSKESRGIYSSQETAKYISAAALLVGNPVSRIMGNFYLGINKTAMPVRMFTSSREAFQWLQTFLPE